METLQPHEPDALLVDDLLDFSCGDIGGSCEEGDDCVASVRGQDDESSCFQATVRASTSAQEASPSLYIPPEELAGELEWLSRFMEDSYRGAEQSMPLVSSDQWFSKDNNSRKEEERGSCGKGGERSAWRASSWLLMSKSGVFCQILDVGSSPLIETRAGEAMKNGGGARDNRGRSKRSSRSGGRIWSLQTVLSKKPAPEEEAGQEEEEEDHSQASSLDYEPFYYYYDDADQEQQPPARKKAKKERAGGSNEEGRRCSHCQVQKTPQWRAGPLGPKTLCNACGVRYKSGRLLPEYRPAASPTFVTELHSNSHKKVLEMRNTKPHLPALHHHHHQDRQDQEERSSSTCSQESLGSLESWTTNSGTRLKTRHV
ncbi:hypothetical protein L7F22_048985 [Adiantum nelumboides]|nr:hypothetical protein [Adiantum nelumboides]